MNGKNLFTTVLGGGNPVVNSLACPDLQNKRVAYLDMLKCLGMFIVVQGHIHPYYGWFSLPLHSFVIPLYFLLSGVTFKRSKFPNFGTFAKHRAKTLLLPYAMFSVITWIIWATFRYLTHSEVDSYWNPLIQTLIAQGSGGFLVHNVPLWFVPCLFVIESMYYFVDKLPKWANLLTCIICAFIGTWMITGPYSDTLKLLPWSIESAFAAIIFYCAGNMLTKTWSLKEIEEKIVANKWWVILTIVVLTLVLINTAHWNGHITLGSDNMGRSPLMFYFNAFMGIISIFLFSVLMCSVKCENILWKKLMNFHLYFGKNSFYIMATHVPVKGFLMVGFAAFLHKSVPFIAKDYLWAAITFAVTCIICAILAYFIGKQKERDHAWVMKKKADKAEK